MQRAFKTAKEFEDMMLFIFSLIAVINEYQYTNISFVIGQLKNRYQEIVASHTAIDEYLENYIEDFSEQTIQTTQDNGRDEWYLSDDRAMFIAENEANTIRKEIDSLTEEIEKTKADFEEKRKATLNDIDNLIAEATKKGAESDESIKASIYTINEEINAERAKLAEIDKVIAEHNLAEKQRARISELESDEKRLAGEYAELDKMAFLIDEFIKFKVKLLSEEINNHFKYAKFKLFEEQINGGIAECCELTYKGVDYSDLNNAARVNSGLDIINTLCELNNRYAPIIVDNAEGATNILPTTSQMIRLVVSADDKMLRIEKI